MLEYSPYHLFSFVKLHLLFLLLKQESVNIKCTCDFLHLAIVLFLFIRTTIMNASVV
jgi:hypothetical protein